MSAHSSLPESHAATQPERPVQPEQPEQAMAGVARGGAANLVGAAVTALATLALTLVITHGLSRANAGVFFSATSLFVLATTIGQLGTGTALVYFLSRARARARQHLFTAYFRTALQPVLLLASGMAVVVLLASSQIAAVTTPGHVEETARYLRVLAVFIPLAGLENVTLAATRGLGTMRPSVLVEQLGRPLSQLAMVAAAVWLVGGQSWLGWAWSFGYLPAAIAACVLWFRALRRRGAPANLPPMDDAAEAELATASVRKQFWLFSLPRAFASVGQIAMQRLDIVLVGALSGVPQAAVYAAATRFLVIGQMGTRAISLAVQPKLAEVLARDNKVAVNNLYQTSTAWLMLVTWPLYLLFLTFGSVLVNVFGSGYQTGSEALRILSCSMLLATGCGMVDMVLNMAGRTAWNLANVVLALVVNIALDVWLIPTHGVLGAAIGWAVAITLQNIVPLAQVSLVLGFHPFGRATATAGAVTALSFGLLPLLIRLELGPSWQALSLALAVGSLSLCAGLRLCRGQLQLSLLRDIRRRRPTVKR